ncbi:MAG: hypothetical protein ACTSO9_20160, partial [Candidatus Helarchaeota archaeon]
YVKSDFQDIKSRILGEFGIDTYLTSSLLAKRLKLSKSYIKKNLLELVNKDQLKRKLEGDKFIYWNPKITKEYINYEEKILKYLKKDRGSKLADMEKKLSIPHHILINRITNLLTAQKIKVVKTKNKNYYYPIGATDTISSKTPREMILEKLNTTPNSTNKMLSEQLNLPLRTVKANTRTLVSEGKLTVQKIGRTQY